MATSVSIFTETCVFLLQLSFYWVNQAFSKIIVTISLVINSPSIPEVRVLVSWSTWLHQDWLPWPLALSPLQQHPKVHVLQEQQPSLFTWGCLSWGMKHLVSAQTLQLPLLSGPTPFHRAFHQSKHRRAGPSASPLPYIFLRLLLPALCVSYNRQRHNTNPDILRFGSAILHLPLHATWLTAEHI